MDLKKNKYALAFLAIVAVAAIHYLFFYKPCVQPTEMQVATIQLDCLMGMDVNDIRKRACNKIYQTEDCRFVDEDKATVMTMFYDAVDICSKKELEKQNKCTDQYRGAGVGQ